MRNVGTRLRFDLRKLEQSLNQRMNALGVLVKQLHEVKLLLAIERPIHKGLCAALNGRHRGPQLMGYVCYEVSASEF